MNQPERGPAAPAPTSVGLFSRVLVQLCIGTGEEMLQRGRPWKGTVMPSPRSYANDPGYVNIMPDEPRGDETGMYATMHPQLYPVYPVKCEVDAGQFVEVQYVLSALLDPPEQPGETS